MPFTASHDWRSANRIGHSSSPGMTNRIPCARAESKHGVELQESGPPGHRRLVPARGHGLPHVHGPVLAHRLRHRGRPALDHAAQCHPGFALVHHVLVSLESSPRRIARAVCRWSRPGRSAPARSATVQASRRTLSTPRADSRPRLTASSNISMPNGSGSRLRRTGPGTSPFVRQPPVGQTSGLSLPGRADAVGHHLAGLARPQRRSQKRLAHRPEVLVDVDAVQDRPGDPLGIPTYDHRSASAVRARSGRIPARAGVGRQDQLEAGRVDRRRGGPGQHDAAGFEGNPEGLHHPGRELRGLVQEEHSPVGA